MLAVKALVDYLSRPIIVWRRANQDQLPTLVLPEDAAWQPVTPIYPEARAGPASTPTLETDREDALIPRSEHSLLARQYRDASHRNKAGLLAFDLRFPRPCPHRQDIVLDRNFCAALLDARARWWQAAPAPRGPCS